MPWELSDVERHKKGLSDKDKAQWVATANSVLKTCLADGEKMDVCEGRAIRIANAAVAEVDAVPPKAEPEEEAPEPEEYVRVNVTFLAQLTAKVRSLLDEIDGAMAKMKDQAPGPEVSEEPEEPEEPVTEALVEDGGGHVVRLAEATSKQGPLTLIAEIIRPGWGNARDKHFYSEGAVQGDSVRIFEGIKMHEVDHREDQRSNENWVSTVGKYVGKAEDGGALFEVAVHDPAFAERVRNLDTLGLLSKLECSILGDGMVRKGFEKDGRKGGIVESFTVAKNVDWVSHAGAGGRAVTLAESAAEEDHIVKVDKVKLLVALHRAIAEATEEKPLDDLVQEAIAEAEVPEPAPIIEIPVVPEPALAVIPAERIAELGQQAHLPAEMIHTLQKIGYVDESVLREQIAEMRAMVQRLTGAGKPWGGGAQAAPLGERLSETDYVQKANAVIARYTGRGL